MVDQAGLTEIAEPPSLVPEGKCPPGCLNTNTVLECPAGSERIKRKIAERLGEMESNIYEIFLKAQTEGFLPLGTDIKALSRFYLAVIQGMTILNKAFADPSVVKDVAKVAISFGMILVNEKLIKSQVVPNLTKLTKQEFRTYS